jgi:hypothetical protein
MGIEPTRAALPELENKRIGARADPKCDGRVNIRGMWGYVGIHRWANPGLEPAMHCGTQTEWTASDRRPRAGSSQLQKGCPEAAARVKFDRQESCAAATRVGSMSTRRPLRIEGFEFISIRADDCY